MTPVYKIMYMRVKSQLPLKDIAEVMEMKVSEVAEIINIELYEANRHKTPTDTLKYYIPTIDDYKHKNGGTGELKLKHTINQI
jgi:hypothetical protein